MIDDPPLWALRDAMARTAGHRAVSHLSFVDVSARVQHPEYDYRAEDLYTGCCVTVFYRGDNHTVYVATPTSNFTTGRKRNRDRATRRRYGRYIYRGLRFRTLSAVARHITGDPTMSGNRFFQLRARRRG